MKKTISEKAKIAIAVLNTANLTMLAQIESGELDKPAADRLILSAQRKAKTFKNAYFFRGYDPKHPAQMDEFDRSGLYEEIEKAHNDFIRTLGIFAGLVGVPFVDEADSILGAEVIG